MAMPYFALINQGTAHEEPTFGLETAELVENFVDQNVKSGHYEPLKDNLITVTILDMTYQMDGTREIKKMYLWDFDGGAPIKVEEEEIMSYLGSKNSEDEEDV
jgi:hypothetical protein